MATLYYNGFVDTDWATLGNWWTDSGFSVAATSLPTITDDVEMWETVDANTGGFIAVHDLAQKVGMLDVILTVTGLATFENDTSYGYGTLTGNATFNGNSTNPGTIVSSATTALLLRFNGSDGSTIFTDSSPNNLTVTANGSVQISTAQSVFGGASALLNGSSDFISVPYSSNFSPLGSAFTIECWLRPDATQTAGAGGGGNAGGIVSLRNAGVYCGYEFSIRTDLTLQLLVYQSGGWASVPSSATALVAGVWSHIALVVGGDGSTTLYINGVADAYLAGIPIAYEENAGDTHVYIGVGGDGFFNGYIDEVRVVKGLSVYTSTFTPPTIQLGLVGINFNGTSSNGAGGETYGDAVFNDSSSNAGTVNNNPTALLLHFNGSDGSTTFTDSSPNELTATANGSVQISTAQSVFGSSSAVFNGGGDNLAIAGDWTWWNTSDYTIEFWLRANAVTGYLPLIFSDNGINAHLYNGGTIHVNDGQTASSIGDGLPIVPDTWTHIAIVRLSGTITLYQDGVVIGTTTQTPNVGGSTFRVGGDGSGNGVAGYIDEVRVVKGFAVYTSSFTPPTSQLGLYP